jgi:hypothetical protein
MEDLEVHRLGWKAFQDLCVAIVEERTNRAVQTFLPTNDAGRDGAFVGRWDGAGSKGNSTIQCKFTSNPAQNLTLSMLKEELPKAKRLVKAKLADDYVILTNHTITGWPAPGSKDTELGVLMEPEVGDGETQIYAGVQA